MKTIIPTFCIAVGCFMSLQAQTGGDGAIKLSGELKQWHKVTLSLNGPFAKETDEEPNPFTDLAFNVTFTHESGTPSDPIPGPFAADGNAGETSAESEDVTKGTPMGLNIDPKNVFSTKTENGETILHTFDFSFKYSVAHMYSITKPPFIQPLLDNMAPNMRTWLTVRNDDIYTFRYGDPTLPDSHFEKALAARHPQASSSDLYRALQGAAQVMPLITRFFWEDIDLKWFPEACMSHRRAKGQGFYAVRHFIEGISMPGANVLCIRDWRSKLAEGKPMEQTTPLEIAAAIDAAAAGTFTALHPLRSAAREDRELGKKLVDRESLAGLGRW